MKKREDYEIISYLCNKYGLERNKFRRYLDDNVDRIAVVGYEQLAIEHLNNKKKYAAKLDMVCVKQLSEKYNVSQERLKRFLIEHIDEVVKYGYENVTIQYVELITKKAEVSELYKKYNVRPELFRAVRHQNKERYEGFTFEEQLILYVNRNKKDNKGISKIYKENGVDANSFRHWRSHNKEKCNGISLEEQIKLYKESIEKFNKLRSNPIDEEVQEAVKNSGYNINAFRSFRFNYRESGLSDRELFELYIKNNKKDKGLIDLADEVKQLLEENDIVIETYRAWRNNRLDIMKRYGYSDIQMANIYIGFREVTKVNRSHFK